MLDYVYRPIEQWPGKPTPDRRPSSFKASWGKTLQLLETELGFLLADNVVIQVRVRADQIRNDGKFRSGVVVSQPEVILSFASRHGPLEYPCDRFNYWQDNVRGIALALQALRAVDRYGVTRRAEQYKGWERLEGPKLNVVAASNLLIRLSGSTVPIVNATNFDPLYRAACYATHPDRGYSGDDFKKVQEAADVLRKHLGISA